MAISGPESGWEKFSKTTALYDLGSGAVTTGTLAAGSVPFFVTGSTGWGWFMLALALIAFVVQGLKARRAYRDQIAKDSVHELNGCLCTLEAVLLGPDLDPAQRAAAGLRLTIHIPDGKGSLVQALDYVGDQRTEGGAGRRLPEHVGVVGKAYRQAQLNPGGSVALLVDSRKSDTHDAFVEQMVQHYGFTIAAARQLSPATMSWAATAIANNGIVEGVLYCDSKSADFFTSSRQEDILHATAGIAYFVGLRYS